MKKNLFYLSVFAALFTTSCSNNDEPNPSGNATGEQYMAVTIKDVNSGSRAVTDGGFEGAINKESEIKAENLYFLFFDDKGNAFPLVYANVNGAEVKTNMVKPITLNHSDETDGSDATGTLTGVLVLGKTTGGYVGTTPSQVLCVANPRTKVMTTLENKSLDNVIGQITTVPDEGWDATNTTFVMTNSTYGKTTTPDTEVITAVNVKDNIKTTIDAAESNPAVIYLERLAVKVRVKYNDSYPVQKRDAENNVSVGAGKFILDNEEVEFTAEINGWQLYNTAKTAYAFKHLRPENYTDWGTWWNDPTKHRSYWAESEPGAEKRKTKYDLYSPNHFKAQSFNVSAPSENVIYCYENTAYPDIEINDRSKDQATAIVIKATIKKDGKPIDMLRWAGAYYTIGALKDKIAKAYVAQNPDAPEDPSKVDFVQDETKNTWHAVYNVSPDNTVTMGTFNNILWWRDGVTSYYANIEHLKNKIGVVRNHIYDYTVDGIVGLGIPGNEPTTPTETESFLACYVRVLNWHLLTNNITLE